MAYAILLCIFFAGFGILAWKDLRLALLTLAGLLPVYLLRFSFGPIPSTALEGLILIAFVAWIWHGGYRDIDFRRLKPWLPPLLLLLLSATVGIAVSSDPIDALGIWRAYFIEPALVFLMMHSVFKRKDWRRLFPFLAGSVAVVSIFGLVQYVFPTLIPVPWDIERRISSVFPYPNALGLYAAPIIASSIILINRIRHDRIMLFIAILLGTTAVILAKTEAAFVAIPGAVLITTLISPAKRDVKIGALSVAAVAFFAVMLFIPSAQSKLLLQDYSGNVRLAQWRETTHMLTERPFFGAGLNAYPEAVEPYHDGRLYEIFQYPHNIALNIWSELGLLGIIAFFWLAVLVARETWRNKQSPVVLAAFAGLTVMTIHGLVDVPYFKNDLSVMTWLYLGAVIHGTKGVSSH